MLREIINFIRSLKPQSYQDRLKLPEGIHISINLANDNAAVKYEFYKQGEELSPFLKTCLKKQIHTKNINMNKAFDSKKKIHSCSPFCVAFKIQTINEIQNRLPPYFEVAKQYCTKESHLKWVEIFERYCENELINLVNEVMQHILEEKGKDKRFKLLDKYYIHTYLENMEIHEFQEVHSYYLKKKAFNKEEFNVEIDGVTFGVSDYLTGYNEKKPFLKHRSAAFSLSNRFSNQEVLDIYQFSLLRANSLLPNPLPIFIEKEELNDQVVSIFNREGEGRISYSEIIREVYRRTGDVGNYYLLNFYGGEVRDFDFVSSFQFKIDPPISIHDFFYIKQGTIEHISDVFRFETNIVQRIFENQLVQKGENGYKRKYFEDIKYNPKYMNSTIYQLVLKYRKPFYDFIYKSQRQSLNSRLFFDIMKNGIMANLKEDKLENGKHSKEYLIKDKLNIWFSLYEFFEPYKTKNGGENMASKIKELQERMKEIAKNPDSHIENDSEFAYAIGQVIYYLLDQSETSNKSHALLEPFLQKTDPNQLKIAISRTFNQYKHAITFYKGKFEKLMAETLSYNVEGNVKELLPMILAGYFASNVIYQNND